MTSIIVNAADGPACCPGAPSQPLDRATAHELATALKAVADPTRLQLLSLIAASKAGEQCVCDLTEPLGLSQPTVSHHLRVLTEAGLTTREQRGTWAWYALVPQRLAELGTTLAALADGTSPPPHADPPPSSEPPPADPPPADPPPAEKRYPSPGAVSR